MQAIVRPKGLDELILTLPLPADCLSWPQINIYVNLPTDVAPKGTPFGQEDIKPTPMLSLRHIGWDERGRDVLPILEEI